jgi:hypothetical protein
MMRPLFQTSQLLVRGRPSRVGWVRNENAFRRQVMAQQIGTGGHLFVFQSAGGLAIVPTAKSRLSSVSGSLLIPHGHTLDTDGGYDRAGMTGPT